jgi:hypothetical protein
MGLSELIPAPCASDEDDDDEPCDMLGEEPVVPWLPADDPVLPWLLPEVS